MSKVDWSKAPNWAKGYGLIGIAQFAVWFDDYYYEYIASGKKHAFDDGCTFKKSDFSYTEERPKQPQAWSGAEDGLPPVGMVVQVWDKEPHKCYAHHVGKSVTILAHRIGAYSDPVAVYHAVGRDGLDEYHALVEDCFRLIQPMQDARESAIRDIMDIAQVDCRVTAARLVDAGFKREVL